MPDLQKEEVVLSDGRKVVVSETTGLDEMIGAQLAGEAMDPEKPGGAQLIMRGIFTAISIKSIDGIAVERPTNLVEVQALMAKFTSRQLAWIGAAYRRLNDDPNAMKSGNAVKVPESKG